jgi:hypothetical protein
MRNRGDIPFADADWAGRIGPGLWIESFSVAPIETLNGLEIEYKGLTSRGFETPWVSNGGPCGTRGMSVPLLGFAMRVKSNASTARYDCEYSGYFQSGATVGPLRNGVPCRSTVHNDPLEGIRLRLVARHISTADVVAAPVESKAAPTDQRIPRQARLGPQFSRLREEAVPGASAILKSRHSSDSTNANLGRFLKRPRLRDAGLGVLPKIPTNLIVGARGVDRNGDLSPADSDVNLPDERQS